MGERRLENLETIKSLKKLEAALLEQRNRQQEALNLFVPTAIQEPIVNSKARRICISGGNRSSKTTVTAYLISCWLTGKIDHPNLPKENGRAYFVGKDATHLGEIMYRKMFRPGAFKVLKDKATGLFRAYDPDNPADVARKREVRQSPPLIPRKLISSESYRLKKDEIPRMVRLKNGWEILFFTGEGIPAQGFDINLCLAGWSRVYDPVAKRYRRIDKIRRPWHVYSMGRDGIEIRKAQVPFVRGIDRIYRFRLSSGATIDCTRRHLVMAADGSFVPIGDAADKRIPILSTQQISVAQDSRIAREPLLPAALSQAKYRTSWPSQPSGVGRTHAETRPGLKGEVALLTTSCNCEGGCDRRFHRAVEGYPLSDRTYLHFCDGQSREAVGIDQGRPPRLGGACERIHWNWQTDEMACGTGRSRHRPPCPCAASEPTGVFAFGLPPRPDEQATAELASQTHGASCRWPDNQRHYGTFPQPATPKNDAAVCHSYKHQVFVESVEFLECSLIWDFGVDVNHNYVHAGIVSHNCWMDEEIEARAWFVEAMRGLIDREGVFIWSATPQAATEQFIQLMERADLPQENPDEPFVAKFTLPSFSNKHIDKREIEEFAAGLSQEEFLVRIMGEPAKGSFLMFPNYSLSMHGIERSELPRGEVPSDWTRYLAMDPGYGVTAILFAAVPPPTHPLGDIILVYDELYLPKRSAWDVVTELANRCEDQTFRAFIIDDQQAMKTDQTSGKRVSDQFYEFFKQRRLKSVDTGHGFIAGLADRESGFMLLREALRARSSGGPKLRFLTGMTPQTDQTFRRLRRKRTRGDRGQWIYADVAEERGDNHMTDCFDSETEVLAYDGWKQFRDVSMADELATVNLETDQIEYQFPTALIDREHDGDMIRCNGKKTDFLVTPNHRMVIYQQGSTRPEIRLAKDLKGSHRIKRTAKWTGASIQSVRFKKSLHYPEVEVNAADFAEFMGWYLSEGCYIRYDKSKKGRGYQVMVSQFHEPLRTALRKILEKLPWNFAEYRPGRFTASSQQLWRYVKQFGRSRDKFVPDWIRHGSVDVINRFLAGAIAGDGWYSRSRSRGYASISKRLSDDIQELILKTGGCASVRRREAESYLIRGRAGAASGCMDQFHVSEHQCGTSLLQDAKCKRNFWTEHYRGRVYCATVPNGTLIVRRGGQPMVAGNCCRYLVAADLKWHEPVKVESTYKSPALLRYEAKQKLMEGTLSVVLGPPRPK